MSSLFAAMWLGCWGAGRPWPLQQPFLPGNQRIYPNAGHQPGLPFPGEPYVLPVKDDVARYLEDYVGPFCAARAVEHARLVARHGRGALRRRDGRRETHIALGDRRDRRISPAAHSGLCERPRAGPRTAAFERILKPGFLPCWRCPGDRCRQLRAQIALELAESGRPIWLSGARHRIHPAMGALLVPR